MAAAAMATAAAVATAAVQARCHSRWSPVAGLRVMAATATAERAVVSVATATAATV